MLLDPTYAHTAVDVSTKRKEKKVPADQCQWGRTRVQKGIQSRLVQQLETCFPAFSFGGWAFLSPLLRWGARLLRWVVCVCGCWGGGGGGPVLLLLLLHLWGWGGGGGGGRCFFSSSAWGWVGWSGEVGGAGVGEVGRGPVISVLLWHSVTVLKRDERWGRMGGLFVIAAVDDNIRCQRGRHDQCGVAASVSQTAATSGGRPTTVTGQRQSYSFVVILVFRHIFQIFLYRKSSVIFNNWSHWEADWFRSPVWQ